jgi:hypothetical protein
MSIDMELKALIIFVLGTDDFNKRNRNVREITPPDNPVTAISLKLYERQSSNALYVDI